MCETVVVPPGTERKVCEVIGRAKLKEELQTIHDFEMAFHIISSGW